MKIVKLIFLSFLYSHILYSQSPRLYEIVDETCNCIKGLDIEKHDLNSLDVYTLQCISFSILDNLDLYEDELNLDNSEIQQEEIAKFLEKQEFEIFSGLMNMCPEFKTLFNILQKGDLKDHQTKKTTGVIKAVIPPVKILVKLENGLLKEFTLDRESKGVLDLFYPDNHRIIGKSVSIEYTELKYYNNTSKEYYLKRRIESLFGRIVLFPYLTREMVMFNIWK